MDRNNKLLAVRWMGAFNNTRGDLIEQIRWELRAERDVACTLYIPGIDFKWLGDVALIVDRSQTQLAAGWWRDSWTVETDFGKRLIGTRQWRKKMPKGIGWNYFSRERVLAKYIQNWKELPELTIRAQHYRGFLVVPESKGAKCLRAFRRANPKSVIAMMPIIETTLPNSSCGGKSLTWYFNHKKQYKWSSYGERRMWVKRGRKLFFQLHHSNVHKLYDVLAALVCATGIDNSEYYLPHDFCGQFRIKRNEVMRRAEKLIKRRAFRVTEVPDEQAAILRWMLDEIDNC